MADIIGFVCFVVLILMVIYLWGEDGQGGNDWIKLFKFIKNKTRRH